jgi:Uma2 family endonuclease
MTSAISTKLTYEDYLLFPDDGKRHEIIDGEHYVTPSPSSNHQYVAGNIHGFLWNYSRERRLGWVYTAPFDVILSDTNVVQPDVVYVRNENLERVERRGLLGGPDLAVEVLSDSTRKIDENLKRKLYERYGVAEYWILDPDEFWIRIYRRDGGMLVLVEQKSDGEITSPVLPGFTLPLSDVFPYHTRR